MEASSNALPDVPSFIALFYERAPNNPLALFLYQWENMVFSLLIAGLLSLLFYLGTRKREMIPSGLQNFLELTTETLQTLMREILGRAGEKYIPFLGTLFLFILSMNWFGLIPFMKSPSSNLNITAAMAISVFVYVQYLNITNLGVRRFLYHLAGSPKGVAGWVMTPLLFPLELLTQITRPVTLALRLFGNMLGEHILIGVAALFGVIFFIFLPLQIPFMLLGLFTGLLQAVVFTALSAVYILLSIPEEEH